MHARDFVRNGRTYSWLRLVGAGWCWPLKEKADQWQRKTRLWSEKGQRWYENLWLRERVERKRDKGERDVVRREKESFLMNFQVLKPEYRVFQKIFEMFFGFDS